MGGTLGPGDVIGSRFELVAKAAAGGMGVVFRGRDRVTGRAVAIKVLHEHAPDAARFERECSLLAELEHPGIVRYVGHGQAAGGALYLVEEWLDGQTLHERMNGAGVTLREAVAIVRRVAEALAMVHMRGIVHRDIKPSNIFLPGRIDIVSMVGDVKLLDFGVARTVRNPMPLTRTGVMVGTPGYFSPEQACGDKQVGPPADVFSLGCVLYECLAGRPAFAGEHLLSLRAKLLIAAPPPLDQWNPAVPRDVEGLVDAMLTKDPAGRPADGAAVVAAIDALADLPETRRVRAAGDGVSTAISPARQRKLDDLRTPARRVSEVVSIVLAAGDASDDQQERDRFEKTSLHSQTLVDTVQPLGAELIVLADGSLVASVIGTDERDVVRRSARVALAIRGVLPDVSIAVVTGDPSSAPAQQLLHEVLERGARDLKAAILTAVFGALAGSDVGDIRLDPYSAQLLSDEFDVTRDAQGSFRLRVIP